MNRLRQTHVEVIADALTRIPSRLRPLVECDVFCADPYFAHIFKGDEDVPCLADGRRYAETPCAAYEHHTIDKRVTVCYPIVPDVTTVLHELGHVVMHSILRLSGWRALPPLFNVSEYAERSYDECFAEAWTAWFYPPSWCDDNVVSYDYSRRNVEWFDRLGLA